MFIMAMNIALMRFGILIALTVMCALLVDLIILPALIRLIYPNEKNADSSTPQGGLL